MRATRMGSPVSSIWTPSGCRRTDQGLRQRMHVIEIENLTHDYQTGFLRKRSLRALDGLSLRVEAGEVFGFLGPNGAGKTTTFKILMRMLRPASGEARILGRPLDDLRMRARIGYLPERPYFYQHLTARELLIYCGALCDLPRDRAARRATELLGQVGLSDSADRRLRKFSKGMLQRVGLAQALINDPEVLFLDEPMSDLDPLGRREARELIAGLRARGKTIFFSSHILTDVEAMCDRVAILNRGRMVESGRLSEILKTRSNEIEAVVSGVNEEILAALGRYALEVAPTPEGARVRLAHDHELARLLAVVHGAGGRLVSVNPARESLEDLFVREVGASAKVEPRSLVSYLKLMQIKTLCNQYIDWRKPGCASLPACSLRRRRIRESMGGLPETARWKRCVPRRLPIYAQDSKS